MDVLARDAQARAASTLLEIAHHVDCHADHPSLPRSADFISRAGTFGSAATRRHSLSSAGLFFEDGNQSAPGSFHLHPNDSSVWPSSVGVRTPTKRSNDLTSSAILPIISSPSGPLRRQMLMESPPIAKMRRGSFNQIKYIATPFEHHVDPTLVQPWNDDMSFDEAECSTASLDGSSPLKKRAQWDAVTDRIDSHGRRDESFKVLTKHRFIYSGSSPVDIVENYADRENEVNVERSHVHLDLALSSASEDDARNIDDEELMDAAAVLGSMTDVVSCANLLGPSSDSMLDASGELDNGSEELHQADGVEAPLGQETVQLEMSMTSSSDMDSVDHMIESASSKYRTAYKGRLSMPRLE
ncbi:hypothetical protein HKX48_001025 [Thoreauomyces humboldtii]|nr:hypothetical protein HKX48_001025 [Thoreauomyces humboldtii]